jgi:hypothetical protein
MGRKACQKRIYVSLLEARAAIAAMDRRYGPSVYKKPYRCGKCKAWHITGTPPPRRSRRVKW